MALSVEERYGLLRSERCDVEGESRVALQERCFAAAGDQTLALALRARTERAEPAPVAIRSRLQDEDVDLMVRDADPVFVEDLVERPAAGLGQAVKGAAIGQPDGEVHVSALVPDGDSRPAERLEAWHLFREGCGNGAEQHDPLHRLDTREGGRDVVGGDA